MSARMSEVTDLLLLAAGKGTRLRGIGDLKPLVEVGGRALIGWAMRAAAQAGVTRVIVVSGYLADRLEPVARRCAHESGLDIAIVHNTDFESPNGKSVLAAAPVLGDSFYLAMCDHIVSPDLYRRLGNVALAAGHVALGVDRRLDNPDVDLEDVTRVATMAGQIARIGKLLEPYDAFDTGVFRAGGALLDAIAASGARDADWSISGGMTALAAAGRAVAIDVGDAFWIDVDSPDMVRRAQRWITGHGPKAELRTVAAW